MSQTDEIGASIPSKSTSLDTEMVLCGVWCARLWLVEATELQNEIALVNENAHSTSVSNVNQGGTTVEEGDALAVRKTSYTNTSVAQDGDEDVQNTPIESPTPIATQEAFTSENKVMENDRREEILKLIHERLRILLEKQAHIISIQKEIASLDDPAAKDISVLRNRMDKCMKWSFFLWINNREHEGIERTYNSASEALASVNDVLKQLEEQRKQLEERKATEFFEFKNRQLQKLKAAEEAIREMLCLYLFHNTM